MAVLIPSLAALREEFDRLAPDRDKSSDGWIGDASHSSGSSDHNPDESGNVPIHDADTTDEVHAIDVDEDLRLDGEVTMEDCVQHLLAECRAGREDRLRYMIYERRIWSASDGWREEYYSGSNPHDKHAHFSGSYDSDDEADTSSWGIEDLMGLSSQDKEWIKDLVSPLLSTGYATNPVWAENFTNPYSGEAQTMDDMVRYAPSRGQVDNLAAQVAHLEDLMEELFSGLLSRQAPRRPDPIPEPQDPPPPDA